MKWLLCMGVAAAMLTASSAFAQKAGPVPVIEEGIDLFTQSFTHKVKSKKGTSTINNLTFYVANQGDTDAPNSRIEYWLSDGSVLDAGDTLIHTQSLGKVKSGKIKKRTVGGGLLKQLALPSLTDKHFLVVVDADNVLIEANEANNLFDGFIFN